MNGQPAEYLKRAAAVAQQSMEAGIGGPFGAAVVKDGEVIAISGNCVLQTNDPTAHAEVQAIRMACQKLGRYDLSDCIIYATCEPCPMCLGAIYWARIPEIIYGSTRHDAEKAGFIDSHILNELQKPHEEKRIRIEYIPVHEAANLFRIWKGMEDKRSY